MGRPARIVFEYGMADANGNVQRKRLVVVSSSSWLAPSALETLKLLPGTSFLGTIVARFSLIFADLVS